MSKKKYDFPTETVELPSKGLLYDKENPLSSGTVEMKYMTAKEEDILTNQNYIEKGTVIDKLLESLIVSNINFSDLYVGDKNNEEVTVDLSLVENKEIDYSALESGVNEFPYTLPHSGVSVTFKFLSHKDEREIENELKGLKRLKKDSSADISTRLKHMIVSVDGESERSHVRKFVDNHLLAMDSRELRKYIKKVQPDIDLSTTVEVGRDKYKEIDIPITLNFFWPDAEL
jgi:hypothetical protein